MSGEKLKRQSVIDLARSWKGPMAAVVLPRAKRVMEIEALLNWTYLNELPKVPRAPTAPAGFKGAWDKVSEWAEELSLAGLDDNRFGVVPDFFAQETPHDDALIVHEAVCALDAFSLALPEDWAPLADLGDMGGHAAGVTACALDALTSVGEDGLRQLRRSPRRLVMRHALLGGAPDWVIDAPEVRVTQEYGRDKWFVREVIVAEGVCGPVSMEVEVDGFDDRRHMPKIGAYRKTYLEPDPTHGCVSRAEYEVWRCALDVLAADLSGRLASIEVLGCERPMRPWECEPVAQGRVLPDLTRVSALDSEVVFSARKKIARNA